MKLFIKSIVLLLTIVFIAPGWSVAQEIPRQDGFVVDAAGVFTDQEVAYLKRELQAFSDTTSNQIVVVTMSDLQGYAPYEIATKIGQDWGVGQKGFDNGVVILFKPKTSNSKGQVFIAPGYGLEGAIPDATTKLIIEREMIPYFKQGNIFQGIVSGITPIKALAVGEYNSDAYAAHANKGSWAPFLIMVIIFLFAMLSRVRAARSYAVGRDIPFWTAMMLMNQSSGHSGHYGNFSSGGGGFGGFGGGGFGGGGAGGSW